jgi:hypothetical protein
MAYFLLISSTVSALSFARWAAAGKDVRIVRNKQLITGACILVVGLITNGFLSGYLSTALQTGNWLDTDPIRKSLFGIYTLQIIGYSTIVTALISYLLMRNGGVLKVRRNLLIYAGLTIGVIVLSPVIQHWVDNMNWLVPPPPTGKLLMGNYERWPGVYVQQYNASLRAWVCTTLAGDLEPLFPYLSTAFAGSVVGIALATRRNDRRLPKIGLLVSGAMFVLGIALMVFLKQGFQFANNRPMTGQYLMLLGGQLFVVCLLLRLVEYRGRTQQFAQGRFGRTMRLWGMASLSIFSLGIPIMLIPRYLVGSAIRLAGGQIPDAFLSSAFGFGQEHWAILFALFVVVFFNVLIVLWSRVNFKYGLEWLIVVITGAYTRERSQRLRVDKLLNQRSGGRP